MSATTAIVAHLLATPAVVDLVGDRIMPELSGEDDAYPQIIYTAEQEEPKLTHSGASTLTKQTIHVAAIGETYGDAENLADAVRTALDCQRGTWGGTVVQGCFLEDQTDNVEFENKDAIYRAKEMTFSVNFQR